VIDLSENTTDSTFQINDVVLEIPPEQITIYRSAQVKQYKPLRTRGSAKVRSASSVTSIQVQTKFVGADDINFKLRALVAQFRLTPFCYVKNNFLSENLLGNQIKKNDEQEEETIALALENLSVSTVQGMPDTWNVMFSFTWFNYKPYSKKFRFKSSLFETTVANNLASPGLLGSTYTPFNDFYRVELEKLVPVSLQTSDLTFDLLEFKVFGSAPEESEPDPEISLEQLRDFENKFEDNAIQLISDISDIDSSATDDLFLIKNAESSLNLDLTKSRNLETLLQDLNNSVQLVKRNNPNKTDLINALTKQQNKLLKLAPTLINKQGWIKFPTVDNKDMTKVTKGQETKTANLYYRLKSFTTSGTDFDSGTVVTSISVNFNHKIVKIPMQGHANPTIQHLGSDDVSFNISISCLDEDSSIWQKDTTATYFC
jgi:hypothetical protein